MQSIIALFTYESNLKYFVFVPNLVQETGSRSKRHIKDQTNLDSKSSNQTSLLGQRPSATTSHTRILSLWNFLLKKESFFKWYFMSRNIICSKGRVYSFLLPATKWTSPLIDLDLTHGNNLSWIILPLNLPL